ncbi:PH domain-containing protein [Levilactobacillus fujinensis]|uniref:PH domain-containing protein n=1 Tax=Levilactobacillus fujinensis TaxID=2486024 RepID=A0ABW1TFS0_9LACO|nr:PH domain-containing protein [Levilactobacillus fujinensis]
MTTPKRTHPLGLFQHIAKSLKDYWFLFILLLSQWHHINSIWFWGTLVLILMAFLIWPTLKWLTLSYAVTPDAVIIHSGIFVRHHEHIPYSRIQTVQRKQWFYLRPFKLEEVLIETASHDDSAPEARLAAVPTDVADTIEHYRHMAPTTVTTDVASAASPSTTDAGVPTATPVLAHYQINSADLVKFGLTSLIFIPFLLVLLGLYNKIPKSFTKIPKSFTNSLINDASHMALTLLIGGVILIIVIAWLGAFLWTLTRYYHFELDREPDQLKAAKGLFQRNTITAPIARIQAVRIKQNLLRQWLHLQTVQVLIASKAASDDDDNDLVIMPVIANQAVYTTMTPFVDWLPQRAPDLTALRVPHNWYLMRNAILFVALPAIGIAWLWPHLSWISILLVIIAVLQGRFAGRNTAGALISPNLLALQTGHFWTREVYYVPADKIQSMRFQQSVWMKKTQLAHLTVNVRHGNHNQAIALRYVPVVAAQTLYDWYLHRA